MSSFLTPGTVLGDGKYLLGRKLGAGSHGDVYYGKDLESDEDVAIKLECWDCQQLFLSHEYQVYRFLHGGIGFPTARWFSQEQRHNVMAMDLLGSSLDSVFQKCGNLFSIKTVLMLADQLLDRVEYLHSQGFIHRSIKPENFSVGRDNPSLVIMIDFGNAKRYKNKRGVHIKNKVYTELGLSNCHSRHQSIGALQRMERSRRDDLESLGYMLIYFLKGCLPWDSVMHDPVALKNVKLGTGVETLCENCPEEFCAYMRYVRNLEFEENPDYTYLRELFTNLFSKLDIKNDGKFDWIHQVKRSDEKMYSTAANTLVGVKVQER